MVGKARQTVKEKSKTKTRSGIRRMASTPENEKQLHSKEVFAAISKEHSKLKSPVTITHKKTSQNKIKKKQSSAS